MNHVAYLNKEWGMLEKIFSGEKTIESRWYLRKICPFGCVKKGDRIYFKNSGEPVKARAIVLRAKEYSDLNPLKVKDVLDEYGTRIGMPKSEAGEYYNMFKNKKYCLLVFLGEVESVEPFDIDKSKAGYCSRAAWVSTPNIEIIKYEEV